MPSPDPKKPRRGSGHDLDVPYQAGDTIPAPEAIEHEGDSAWQMFNEINRQHDNRFADTAPASESMKLSGGEGNWAPTQPAAGIVDKKPPPRRPLNSIFTLEAAMLVARKNNRVCPRPARWEELVKLLPPRKTLRGQQNPPAPVTGPAWAVTPALTKRLCFREHIEWAERQGVLEAVMQFMQTMPEAEWLHMGED